MVAGSSRSLAATRALGGHDTPQREAHLEALGPPGASDSGVLGARHAAGRVGQGGAGDGEVSVAAPAAHHARVV